MSNQVVSNPFGFSEEQNNQQDDFLNDNFEDDNDNQNFISKNKQQNNAFNIPQNKQKSSQQFNPNSNPKNSVKSTNNSTNNISQDPFAFNTNIDLSNNDNDIFQSNQNQNQNNDNINNYDEEDEPPLLEDLGIDIKLIKERLISVIKCKKCDERFLVESDMSGPIILGFALGFFMMLSGKIHFGYIYGFGICGTISLYLILNWLSQYKNLELYSVLSILGYCLLPIVFLSFFSIFISLVSFIGSILATIAVIWATYVASTFFEEVLQLNHQKYLAAYPIFLFYCTFVLITIF